MRKIEKEITDRAEIDAIIRDAVVCRLAMSAGDRPYIVPLCFGYRDDTLFFHTGRTGMKVDILSRNPRVCFELESEYEVITGKTACKWSMRYKSVVGTGTASFVESPADKRRALDIIMQHYAHGRFEYPDAIVEKTAVIAVAIAELTGKASP
jgi:hypothetical protein